MCSVSEEPLEHLFFSCPVSNKFWADVKKRLSFKLDDIPNLDLSSNLFYVDNLNFVISDMITVIILLGKYHTLCCKWRHTKPSFVAFMNEFKMFYGS